MPDETTVVITAEARVWRDTAEQQPAPTPEEDPK